MSWDRDKAVQALNAAAGPVSLGRCAQYTRAAIEAGGAPLTHHECAKDYGPSLLLTGFGKLLRDPEMYLPGDVGIVSAILGHPCGHMAMFNGVIWVSDFRQLHGLYPGPAYRAAEPPYEIYRYVS